MYKNEIARKKTRTCLEGLAKNYWFYTNASSILNNLVWKKWDNSDLPM